MPEALAASQRSLQGLLLSSLAQRVRPAPTARRDEGDAPSARWRTLSRGLWTLLSGEVIVQGSWICGEVSGRDLV